MRILFSLVFLFLLGACAPKATVSLTQTPLVDTIRIDSTPVAVAAPQADAVDQLSATTDDLNFTYLKAKSKVVWKTKNNSDTYIVDIRMKKDSIIWANISVSMISGAAVLFTKDRVQFFDKINTQYTNLTYDSLSTSLGFKVSYDLIQNMIVGNQPYKKNNTRRVVRENENFIVKQQEGLVEVNNWVGPNRKLKKLSVSELPSSNKLTLDYEDFANLNTAIFPFSSSITLDVKNKDNQFNQTLITIKYSKVELLETPLEFPFKVPAKLLKQP
jgi:hypothetical protein